MKRYPLYIFDMDGTLFRGSVPTPGALETVAALRSGGSHIRFLTNNSTQCIDTFVRKLNDLGFVAAPNEVFSSSLGTAEYLKGHVRTAFVVGEVGLSEALRSQDIAVTEQHPEAVAVGLCRAFTYELMRRAMQYLLDPKVRFVATNRDPSYPLEGGALIPGAGSIVAAIATCSGREPEVVGKPNPFLIEWILREAGVNPTDALVVGDRMDTDIEAGIRAGCPVHLVLCGVTPIAPDGVPHSADLRGLL